MLLSVWRPRVEAAEVPDLAQSPVLIAGHNYCIWGGVHEERVEEVALQQHPVLIAGRWRRLPQQHQQQQQQQLPLFSWLGDDALKLRVLHCIVTADPVAMCCAVLHCLHLCYNVLQCL